MRPASMRHGGAGRPPAPLLRRTRRTISLSQDTRRLRLSLRLSQGLQLPPTDEPMPVTPSKRTRYGLYPPIGRFGKPVALEVPTITGVPSRTPKRGQSHEAEGSSSRGRRTRSPRTSIRAIRNTPSARRYSEHRKQLSGLQPVCCHLQPGDFSVSRIHIHSGCRNLRARNGTFPDTCVPLHSRRRGNLRDHVDHQTAHNLPTIERNRSYQSQLATAALADRKHTNPTERFAFSAAQ